MLCSVIKIMNCKYQSDMIKDCEIDYSSLSMSSRKLQNNISIIPIKQSYKGCRFKN